MCVSRRVAFKGLSWLCVTLRFDPSVLLTCLRGHGWWQVPPTCVLWVECAFAGRTSALVFPLPGGIFSIASQESRKFRVFLSKNRGVGALDSCISLLFIFKKSLSVSCLRESHTGRDPLSVTVLESPSHLLE